MARLSIRLLGSFEATVNEQPVTHFESDKVRALLAYLAVEADRPHRRESLAGMLWPEMPERTARANLRYALADLRQVIGDQQALPPFLLITRQTLQFNRDSDAWIDAGEFSALVPGDEVRQRTITQLEQAVALFRGEFLAGFTLRDSAAFEEWVLLQREHLARLRLAALHRLTAYHEAQGAYETALRYAWEQVEIEPWQEDAHRQLMKLLVTTGQRTAALAQFESLRQVLQQELDVDPSPETEEIYRRILSGEIAPEAAALRDQIVRGYDLLECIGEGDAGAVYRAFQPILGREVAVKVILPRFANRPEFIRRFEVEAQLVARLEHLHIVPLYDYWREPDGAYLVMRLFRAGSLKDSLLRGPWEPEAAARALDQIASALAAAHGQGVVHQDIKPANILLDEAGDAYLGDFGIARDVTAALEHVARETMTGSPEYAAPEQWQGGPIGPLADLYSLGVVLFEMLTGQHPFLELSPDGLRQKHLFESLPSVCTLRPDLPAVIDQIVQQATAKNPQNRFSDALTMADAFRRSLAVPPAITPRAEPSNPYKGLRPFQEADAPDFFGRHVLIQELLARLEAEGRFLAVVGPSGSGKSSVVRAGLIPALRRGALSGSENWFIVTMQPGSDPFQRLETALLRIASQPPRDLLGQLRGDEQGLLRAVEMIAPGEADQLVLVVDQFEEIFTLVENEGERARFLASLLAAVAEPGGGLRLVVTVRADHYDRPLQYGGFGELVKRHTDVVLPLSPEELEMAIVGPAERAGVTLESGLVAAIIADVIEQPGALPLLQYALTELFESREGKELTLEAYQAMGGVLGSLGRRAEDLYGSLDEGGKAAARQLFLQLVTLHEGLEVGRRRVLRPNLAAVAGDREVVEGVIDAFGRHRLLSFDRDPATRIPTVEVAHEALFREWDRLRAWLEEDRDELRSHQRLAAAAAEWLTASRDPGFLLRGTRLDQFEAWVDTTDLALSQAEQDYLQASLAERRERQAEEAARQAREKALERRSRNVLRTLVVVLLVATLGALGLAAFARNAQTVAEGEALARATQKAIAEMEVEARATQQTIAEEQTRIATARELAMAALNDLDVDPERSILLAMQAVTTTYAVDQTVLREAGEALHQAVHASRVVRTVPGGRAEAFSRDGTRFATIGEDDTVTVWDISTEDGTSALNAGAVSGEALFTLQGHSDTIRKVIFSPDETRLATTSIDGTARIWEAGTGEELLILEGHTAPLISPAFSPDGARLATSSLDGTARVWDAVSGEELLTLPHSGLTGGVSFSSDGTRLAVADHDAFSVKVWDALTGEERLTLTGHTAEVNDVVFSPDGEHLATASSGDMAKVWDATNGEELLTLEGHDAFVFGVDWSPDGGLIATGSEDGTARVWDVSAAHVLSGAEGLNAGAPTGNELLTLAGHTAGIDDVAFSQDGQYLFTNSADGTARVWDITPEGSREVLTLAGHDDVVFRVVYSTDETRLATASFDGTAKVWDLSSERSTGQLTADEIVTLAGHEDLIYDAALNPDGRRLATASRDGTVKLWDVSDARGEELLTLAGHAGPVFDVDWSPDGTRLATANEAATAKVWDPDTGQELLTLQGHSGEMWSDVFGVAFSPDGSLLATASWDHTAKVWDAGTGQTVLTLEGHTSQLTSVTFGPDGTRLATASFDGTAKVWDLAGALEAGEGSEALHTLSGHAGIVWDVAFSPDSTYLATAGFDGTTRLWDPSTGEELLILTGHPEGTTGVAFSPDGTHLAVSGGDGTVRIYVLPIEELMDLARTRLTRSLTEAECRQYLHLERCP